VGHRPGGGIRNEQPGNASAKIKRHTGSVADTDQVLLSPGSASRDARREPTQAGDYSFCLQAIAAVRLLFLLGS
jgi:hypothetical protein